MALEPSFTSDQFRLQKTHVFIYFLRLLTKCLKQLLTRVFVSIIETTYTRVNSYFRHFVNSLNFFLNLYLLKSEPDPAPE